MSLNDLPIDRAKRTISAWLADRGSGDVTVTYKLHDWLFSRQRYWGEPFPIVFDEHDLPIAVPDHELPVLLPEVDDYSPRTFAVDDTTSEPEPPLGRADDWVEVVLDLGDGPKTYRRELSTMPNWAGILLVRAALPRPHQRERLRRPRGGALLDGAAVRR